MTREEKSTKSVRQSREGKVKGGSRRDREKSIDDDDEGSGIGRGGGGRRVVGRTAAPKGNFLNILWGELAIPTTFRWDRLREKVSGGRQ